MIWLATDCVPLVDQGRVEATVSCAGLGCAEAASGHLECKAGDVPDSDACRVTGRILDGAYGA